jgi:hypothetical protein
MTHDDFIAEYYKVSERAIQLSEKARKEGLLSLEESIDYEKLDQRDIFEYDLIFVVDGADVSITKDILSRIIEQEDDKYTRRLMDIKLEAAISIQCGDNTLILASKLYAFTDIALADDPIFKIIDREKDAYLESFYEKVSHDKKFSSDPFNEILKLDNRAIQKMIREVDCCELGKVLKSVDAVVLKRIFQNMTKRAAQMLMEDMEYMGPIRLKDVQDAQRKIFSIIHHLSDTGEIIIPNDFISPANFEAAITLNSIDDDALLKRGNEFYLAGEKVKARADFEVYMDRILNKAGTAGRETIYNLTGLRLEDI